MTPAVSVFIPAYNAAPYIGHAIQSVLGQTHRDLELLVLDDASTDATAEAVRPHLADKRVRYIRNDANLGMSRNWNKGISLLESQYIAKLDADDYYEPEFLRHILHTLERDRTVGLAFCGYRRVGDDTSEHLFYTSEWICDGNLFLLNVLRKFVLCSPTVCVRKSCYDKMGHFVPGMRIHSDLEMWVRIASTYRVAYVNAILANYRVHGGSCTAQAQDDTRSQDDFTLWLDLLSNGAVPYSLDSTRYNLLECFIARTTRSQLLRAYERGRVKIVKACASLLCRLHVVPWLQKLRYLTMAYSRPHGQLSWVLWGDTYLHCKWRRRHEVPLRLPATNPADALG